MLQLEQYMLQLEQYMLQLELQLHLKVSIDQDSLELGHFASLENVH